MPAYKPTTECFAAGRLRKPMSELAQQFNEAPRLRWEVANLESVLKVDFAHVIMLHEQGYLSKEQAASMLQELKTIRSGGPETFGTAAGYGSIALQIERKLSERISPEIAGRMPIARSRLDHGGTFRRIVDRAGVLSVLDGLLNLQETFIRVATKYANTSFVSYTHMQQAQPTTFGHYLLAYNDRVRDCFEQLCQIYDRTNRCPLGAVGLSGTDLNIDRERTASLLGFSHVLVNSRLGRDANYEMEITFALTLLLSTLNDLCSDLHICASVEFGTIDLDDGHCSTSSIFPQKKNPYALETVKATAADSQGWLAGTLARFRCEGSFDTAIRCTNSISDYCSTTKSMLSLTCQVVDELKVNEDRCERLLINAWVTTNRLANVLLMQHGLSYRSSHSLVGRLVRNCVDQKIAKSDVTIDMLQKAAEEMGMERINMSQTELQAGLGHKEYIAKSISQGSVGPKQVKNLVRMASVQFNIDNTLLEHKLKELVKANDLLDSEAEVIINSVE